MATQVHCKQVFFIVSLCKTEFFTDKLKTCIISPNKLRANAQTADFALPGAEFNNPPVR